jgi:anti-anti-sigma factor
MPEDRELQYCSRAGSGDGVVVMTLDGPLTLRNIFTFQKDIAADQPRKMIFDLSGVEYMDSAGLGVLMNYFVSARDHGRRMALVGVNERLAALFEMTRVSELLKSYPTVEAAEAALAE